MAFKKTFSNLDTQLLRKSVHKNNDKLLVFVQKNNPKNPNIFCKIRQSFESLKSSELYSKAFSNTKLIKSERQPPNLGKLLRHSNIDTGVELHSVIKCGRSNCGTCPHLLETSEVYFHRANATHNLKASFSCNASNIIYKVTCLSCFEYYIGETVHLRHRVSNHKTCIEQDIYRTQKVHHHLFECAKDLEVRFTIVPFYQVKEYSRVTRKAVESYFIRKYKPLLNDDRRP